MTALQDSFSVNGAHIALGSDVESESTLEGGIGTVAGDQTTGAQRGVARACASHVVGTNFVPAVIRVGAMVIARDRVSAVCGADTSMP
ncbi:MAG: hypothetical protein HLX51_02015 [Micrococcaceae bacterium]|nr:hypothetical protein [Micrococcaceae bacterium]